MVAQQEGADIPEGWALDAAGRPTRDPAAALAGTMLPMGDAKGAALVLMVEVLAAAVTAANFGYEASSFFNGEGRPPNVGQLLIALAPGPLSDHRFADRLEDLLQAILSQPGTRLPGDRRLTVRQQSHKQGLVLSQNQYDQLIALQR